MSEVPFSMDLYAGLGMCQGILKADQEALELEFQIEDAILSVVKSKIRNVRIPYEDVLSIELTKGWFDMRWLGVKIIIQLRSLEAIQDIPDVEKGRLVLSISRRDIDLAEKFIANFYDGEE